MRAANTFLCIRDEKNSVRTCLIVRGVYSVSDVFCLTYTRTRDLRFNYEDVTRPMNLVSLDLEYANCKQPAIQLAAPQFSHYRKLLHL
jgi:hypothetical protein